MIDKANEIIKAWWIAENPTEEQSIIAEQRLEVCINCEYNENSLLFNMKCSKCGCPISKKIFSPKKGSCPIGKWNEIDKVINNNIK